MTSKKNSILFVFLTTIYLAVIIYCEDNITSNVDYSNIVKLVPMLLCITILSWIIRYLRWRYLLRAKEVEVFLINGFFIYLTGFAYTITPGKLGEMIRAKYLANEKGREIVFSAFFFERMLDLITVFFLSTIAFSHNDYILTSGLFVLIVFSALYSIWRIAKKYSYSKKKPSFNKLILIVLKISSNIRIWLKFKILLVSFLMGFVAWLLIGLILNVITIGFGLSLPIIDILGIYPLSMLIGAASMIPGGVGSTEVATITLLSIYSVESSVAISVAIIARLITLWFAVLAGFISIWFLELKNCETK
ncbi:flippase-like domain-containing protein [Vibrio mimicus]